MQPGAAEKRKVDLTAVGVSDENQVKRRAVGDVVRYVGGVSQQDARGAARHAVQCRRHIVHRAGWIIDADDPQSSFELRALVDEVANLRSTQLGVQGLT